MKSNLKVLLLVLAVLVIMASALIIGIENRSVIERKNIELQHTQILQLQQLEIRIQKLEEKQEEIIRNQEEIIKAQITTVEILAHLYEKGR